MILQLPQNPSVQDFIRAKVQYEETVEKPYQPIKIPKLKYPKSSLRGAGVYGFLASIMP